MERISVHNAGWSSDANVSGDFVTVIKGIEPVALHLDTRLFGIRANIDFPGEEIEFVRISIRFNDRIYIAGKGQETGKNWIYCNAWVSSGKAAWVSPTSTYGNNPVIFDYTEKLLVVTGNNLYQAYDLVSGILSPVIGGLATGAQGFRYVDYITNTPVTCDSTYGPDKYNVAQYTNLNGIICGQSYVDGALAVGDKRYQLEPGSDCAVVRGQGDGKNLAFAIVHQNKVNPSDVLYFMTISELNIKNFPLEPSTPTPIPPEPIGPTSPADSNSNLYDIGDYILSSGNGNKSGPTHPQNEVLVKNGIIHFVKFNNPQAYETWGLDENWIYHLEDASGDVYSFSDTRWFPRQLKIGEKFAFITGPHTINYRNRVGCSPIKQVPINRKMWLLAAYPGFYWGSDLGNCPTIVLVYDNTAGIYNAGRMIELYYFALGAGWVRWEAHRSDLVYQNGAPVFNNLTLEDRSDFYLINGPNTQPQLTGCVPESLPVPPIPIPPKPVQLKGNLMVFSKFDPTKVYPYKQLKPSSFAGCFNVILVDGTVLSAQGDSRPSGTDGPWEAGEVVQNEVTYHDGTNYYTYLIVPVDLLP